ncbi:tetratricopeptide repeat protein [Paenibacillus sp. CAU 1782]
MSNEKIIDTDIIQEMREKMDAAYARRDFTGSLEASYRILQHIPDDGDALYTQGSCYYMLLDYDNALQTCKQLLARDPEFSLFTQLTGRVYFELGEWDKSIQYLKQSAERDPNKASTFFLLADAYFRSKNPSQEVAGIYRRYLTADFLNTMELAEQAICRAIELRPAQAGQHALYGALLSTLVREEEAEVQFREAIVLEPMNSGVHSNFARHAYTQGRLKQCREHTEQALLLDPNDRQALFLAQKLELYQTNPGAVLVEVIKMQQIRTQIAPNPAPLYLNAARLMMEEGSLQPVAELRAYLKLMPDDQNAAILYGQALFNDKRYIHARSYFKRMLAQYPDNAYAKQWYEKSKKVSPVLILSSFLIHFLFYHPVSWLMTYLVFPFPRIIRAISGRKGRALT